jgi:energy-coupling factor transporter ATP-binding protein EcfA2
MLTRLRIRNFKQFEDVDIELGQSVVLIGPNNSGKTTALQALALWAVGIDILRDKGTVNGYFSSFDESLKPFRVTINRLDLVAAPVVDTVMLWHNLLTRNDKNIHIEVDVEGIFNEILWSYGLEFRYSNEESLFCLPLVAQRKTAAIPDHIKKLVFLPPMSGLVAVEPRIERGRINVLIGEGRTAEVLRNLCLQVYEEKTHWPTLVEHIRKMFEIEILPPEYLVSRGEIRMAYKDRGGVTLDLSSSGRGMLQILLLIAYMYTNPGAVLLLDEPDAHLEILRQKEVYQLLTDIAQRQASQVIIATHSEVVMNEAFDRDTVVAFYYGKPRLINDNQSRSQLVKALGDIPFDHYYQAEQTGWVLYAEGATDFAILRALAIKLDHPSAKIFDRVFTHGIDTNQPQKVREHFYGLKAAKPDLVGFALFDRIEKNLGTDADLTITLWRRREIENYLAMPETLLAYARHESQDAERREQVMQEVIQLLVPPIALNNPSDKWWADTKMSDDFLDRLFDLYFEKLSLPNLMRKTNYHILAEFVPKDKIDLEVVEKLDAIVEVANRAKPRQG